MGQNEAKVMLFIVEILWGQNAQLFLCKNPSEMTPRSESANFGAFGAKGLNYSGNLIYCGNFEISLDHCPAVLPVQADFSLVVYYL